TAPARRRTCPRLRRAAMRPPADTRRAILPTPAATIHAPSGSRGRALPIRLAGAAPPPRDQAPRPRPPIAKYAATAAHRMPPTAYLVVAGKIVSGDQNPSMKAAPRNRSAAPYMIRTAGFAA